MAEIGPLAMPHRKIAASVGPKTSMGWTTTEDEVEKVAEAVIECVRAIRKSAAKVTS